jgi:hypothetical protein
MIADRADGLRDGRGLFGGGQFLDGGELFSREFLGLIFGFWAGLAAGAEPEAAAELAGDLIVAPALSGDGEFTLAPPSATGGGAVSGSPLQPTTRPRSPIDQIDLQIAFIARFSQLGFCSSTGHTATSTGTPGPHPEF